MCAIQTSNTVAWMVSLRVSTLRLFASLSHGASGRPPRLRVTAVRSRSRGSPWPGGAQLGAAAVRSARTRLLRGKAAAMDVCVKILARGHVPWIFTSQYIYMRMEYIHAYMQSYIHTHISLYHYVLKYNRFNANLLKLARKVYGAQIVLARTL